MPRSLLKSSDGRCNLHCPTAMPKAGTFLWNANMLLQVNCRGFAVAQYMQPEPRKYSHGPLLEQKTFMQPEQPHFAHHPGRFVYIKDEQNNEIFSIPYEPVRAAHDRFVFSAGRADVRWEIEHKGLHATLAVSLPDEDVVELWTLTVHNAGDRARRLSIYPYFSIGYMSWMNQSAAYDAALQGIVARSVTPYQKLEDYPKIKTLKDMTFLVADRPAQAWECSLCEFEGEGGLHNPDALHHELLHRGSAAYETPAAVLQYRHELPPGATETTRLLFGPAQNAGEIASLRGRYFKPDGFVTAQDNYARYLKPGSGCLEVQCADEEFASFVNQWLPRQVYYHGTLNRLTTDPQTRNYLQDGLGMVYIDPAVFREKLIRALSQQEADGALPEGIRLNGNAELKYINQIPHTDHNVWLPITLSAYLDETGDHAILDEPVTSNNQTRTVSERVAAALEWLIGNVDNRNLSLIAQGDWCDPMNMVGHKGAGVSAWLSMATVEALRLWVDICERHDVSCQSRDFGTAAQQIAQAVREHLWDGDWFARGITDAGNPFGISTDAEGSIYLNPQSWSLLAGIADAGQQRKILAAVERMLDTPYGTMMLAPAYTEMREDIGRLTQKHPGYAENGSIYNHAATFYALALYRIGEADRAFEQIRRMLPGPEDEDYRRRGQLPVFVPNYYRGAVHQFPHASGRSSQLFHTGACSWLYRLVIEELYGLKGQYGDLRIAPQLPSAWTSASAERRFRSAQFSVRYRRLTGADRTVVTLDGVECNDGIVRDIEPGRHYRIDVTLPEAGR